MKNINKSSSSVDIHEFCQKKMEYYEDIVQKTAKSASRYKVLDVYGASELNICIKKIEMVYHNIQVLKASLQFDTTSHDEIMSNMQEINDDLCCIFKTYGTKDIEDLLQISFGVEYGLQFVDSSNADMFDIIKTYVNPISFNIIPWKKNQKNKVNKKVLSKNRIVEDFSIVEISKTLDCFDLARTSRNFLTKVYGIKIAFQNEEQRKTLILCGLVDDVLLECFYHPYTYEKLKIMESDKPKDTDFHTCEFTEFTKSLTLKELLIYNNEELYNRFNGYQNQVNLIKQKPISQVVKEFINSELYGQRKTLIQLLLKENNPEYQYLAYLLYDLLSNDNNNMIDTHEQTLIYDSLPWSIRKLFRTAMKTTISYTKNLSNFDNSKIPLEQQICLMKASDSVKEKAMTKLKEVKAKSEDSGSKARQYLEGLLKIPFGIYKTEPILQVMKGCVSDFSELTHKIQKNYNTINIPVQDSFTSIEMSKYLRDLENKHLNNIEQNQLNNLISILTTGNRTALINNICKINTSIKMTNVKEHKLVHSGKKSQFMRQQIKTFVNKHRDSHELMSYIKTQFNISSSDDIKNIRDDIKHILCKWNTVTNTMSFVRNILDKAIYGHDKAKRSIERIIGQWMNGELSGYCFGFEGPPGVGKTSLAKNGLAYCLQDENNNSRPFGFIPIGGSSNGSILDGHNYTYVGSTWGRIADVLMESKCMNPIIFIDELDKISQTEHGKELIGILTHLVDPTQNDSFQDKYFNGINLDLSKALIIFSYNDVDAIDRILLDRIHRIKFEPLKLEEKMAITNKYMLPEIYKKVGLTTDVINIADDVIEYIIQTYTYESGVRKLKEILFEIISEINLEILNEELVNIEIPLHITRDMITSKYLNDHAKITPKTIHTSPQVGIINGLWANSLGKGGIIPIQAQYYPTKTFLDLKLTGMQGDVMKESMNVAKTLAYKITSVRRQKTLLKNFKETNMQGLHIHCPEGAVPKDGPSAGTAITIALYSLFNNKPIKNNVAITGEITLQGNVTAIGGLKLKILGGIKAGVTTFIFPQENNDDFKRFMDENKDNDDVKDITFHMVSHIDEVKHLIF